MICPRCQQDNSSDSRFCRYCAAPLSSPGEQGRDETLAAREPGQDILPGDEIAGKYKIVRKVDEGGMGMVFEAEDLRLKRRVALKFLAAEQTRAPESKQRFFREAQASSKLDHPNICTIFEIGEDEAHRLFIAMAYCQGESLKERLKRGPVPAAEALEIAIQVCRGMACAHDQGIIHRDIKPGNIMGTEGGEVKIVDFGLAKIAEDSAVTRTAGMTGTLAYMSPEQIQGEKLDFQTDIWSLGVVMYEMFTGLHPFKADTAQSVINAVLNTWPMAPTEVGDALPARLDLIVLRCLAKEKRQRYPTARALMADLEQLKRALAEEPEGRPGAKKRVHVKKETEQRQATVMFVEINGIADMLETVDPREAASILKRCRECFDFIEDAYGGRVDRVADSTYRAVFGFPDAIEDAPVKAVRAALTLREKFEEMSRAEALGTPLRPAIGIGSGLVIAGMIATDEDSGFTIMGEAVALASHLKDLAGAGSILVGPAAVRKTRESFDYRTRKPVILKGREKAIAVFELVAAKDTTARRRLGTERIISSKLVGRAKELDQLQLHVLKTVNGEGSIVNVFGEAGVGKSALIAELKASPFMAKVRLVEGSALSVGKNLSFHPLIGVLRNWADIREDDGPAESAGKLEKAVRLLGPEGPEEIFPFIATLMGYRVTGRYAERLAGMEGEALEKFILKSLRDLLAKASRSRPLVVMLEDLHWADLTSIRFLESVYRLAENNPILFLNVFRPDYEETSQRLLQTVRSRYGRFSLDIPLEPLNEADSETLISNLLKLSVLPVGARELIVGRTGGNPLFIEEVLRSLIDDGVVEVKDGAFNITDRIHSVVLPETVHELLMARIDKLDEDTKSLLKVAAVIGRSFFHRILVEVAGTVPEIDVKLEVLKESQLIRERKVRDEVEWLFKHALVQEAAYESILPKKRKELHLKIARAIESVFAERLSDHYGMLALHFSKGEDMEKAETYLIRAGQEALNSSASDEALHYYQEALRIYLAKSGAAADPEKVAMLRKNIGVALFDRGRLFEAIDHFEQAMTLYGAKKPRGPVAGAFRFLGGFLNFVFSLYVPSLKFRKVPGEKEQAVIDLYKRKMTALSVTLPRRMFLESFYFSRLLVTYDMTKVENGLGILAGYSAIFSWPGVSFTLSRRILRIVEGMLRPENLKPWIYFRFSEAIHRFLKGEWDRIPPCDDALVAKSLKISEFFYTTNYIDILCHLHLEKGRAGQSREYLRKVQDIAATYDYDYAKDEFHFLRTLLLTKLRRIPEALRAADEGLTPAKLSGYTPDLFALIAFKAKAQVLLDDLAGAEKTLQDLDRVVSKENVVPLYRSWCLMSHFIFDLRQLEGFAGPAEGGGRAALLKRARRTGRKMLRNSRKAASEKPEVYRALGVLEWTRGRQGRALKWWAKSIAQAERLGANLELAWTCREVGTRLRERSSRYRELNRLGSEQLLAKADALFREMEAPETGP